ncbi:MAG TPA: ATP-binding protein, partial [Candidatus Brocadiales bacterium]|nr:ATP-binding protein [Candidatus Brocadiales bacterium]
NGVKIHDFNFDSVSRWYGVPEYLSLAYNNNNLSFQFVGITLQAPKKVKYQYKLEGLDKNWSALTSRSEATYGNLSHGKYNFKVKAMNGEGYWSKELAYSFVIRPPWWLTWWAYTIYGLLVVVAAWSIHRYQKRRIIRKEQEKAQKKELELGKEIEKAYTNLKATQAQLIQSEKMASLGELTAGIAHEIQNPLNFVNNFSEINKELLEEIKGERSRVKGERNEELEGALLENIIDNEEKINQHGKRADAIVKSMLQHSSVSSGQKEMTDINALADEYLRLAFHGLRAKDKDFNASMKTDFDESIDKVNIISQDMGRVLLNLINNAFYAVSERKKQNVEGYEPTVSVSTKKIDNKVLISVKDNGNGIPQKVLDKIFQPFFTTKPTGQGTGLGLSLAYDIVKAHSGEIKVESAIAREGDGTEFIVSLPIQANS